mgnify:CR=1 FL=1
MADIRVLYFDVRHALAVQAWIIERSGGRPGLLSRDQLESPLEHIKNDDYYPDFLSKLTFLVYAINKNHAFNDGNKRSSIALGAYFMELNGYDYAVQRFVREMENVAVWVADNKIDRDLLGRIIESLIYEEEYPESLKLDIITATS